jgi:hypothetical protein
VNTRATVALAVILILVVGYIVVIDRPQAQRAEEAQHLVQLPKAEITMITLESSKGSVALSRRDTAHWEVTRPFHAPAASFAVGDLLDAVTGAVPQRTLRGATDLASYGLASPAATIALRTAAGRSVTLEIGTASPVGGALYARVVPGSAVYLLDSSIKDSLTKSATDLRQKTLADFANADVQQARIVSPKGSLTVDRVGRDRWRIEGAHPWPGDDFKVTDLFFALTTQEAKVFHDGVTDVSAYRLDHPAVTVEIRLQEQTAPLRVLLADAGKVVYGTVEGSGIVLEFDRTILAKLEPDPLSLVTRRILPYNPQDLTSLVWRRAGHTREVRRQGPGFTGGGLRESEISDMFSSVNLLDADTVRPLVSPPPGSPAFEVQTDGAPDARFLLEFYRQPTGWTVTDKGLGLEYHLAANALDGLPQPLKAFLGLEKAAPAPATPKK